MGCIYLFFNENVECVLFFFFLISEFIEIFTKIIPNSEGRNTGRSMVF